MRETWDTRDCTAFEGAGGRGNVLAVAPSTEKKPFKLFGLARFGSGHVVLRAKTARKCRSVSGSPYKTC